MSTTTASKKGPVVDPGKCRCCGLLKKCRLLNHEYESFGKREVYSEMFVDCFGLVLSNLDGEDSERLICATCVVRLRDANDFRHQVLRCEEQLLNATVHVHEANEDSVIKLEIFVKEEEDCVEQPATVNSDAAMEEPISSLRNDDHNSDDVPAGDVGMDVVESSKVAEIKSEPIPPTPEPSTRKRRIIKRPSVQKRATDGARSADTVTVARSRMANKIQIVKSKLIKKTKEPRRKSPKRHGSPPSPLPPKYQRPPIQDKEMNTIKNTVTIIENSYLCPFIAVFSDYHCLYCREMFIEPDKLREHTLEHDPRMYQEFITSKKIPLVDITRIDCRLCQTHIDNIDVFKEHITKVHNKVLFKDVDTEFIKFKLKSGKLDCLECGKTFNYFQALRKHMAEHFGTFICDACGAHYFEERLLIIHKKTHVTNRSVEMFPCSECDKTFRSKNSRNFHVARIHRNEAAYPCNKCEEVFISYHVRYMHKMKVHGEKREFPCEQCDKIYISRKTLREHVQRTHLQLLRHECNVCDKKFYLPSALRDHMTSHTGERLYRCDYCGKTYPRKKALKVHMQSHNSEKKYKCSLCPSSYTQPNNLKNHMKSKHPGPQDYNEGYR